MTDKKYAFEGRFGKYLKLPIYVTFETLNVIENEDGETKVEIDGEPNLVGRNKFYDILLGISLFCTINYFKLKITLDELLKVESKEYGFYFTLEELIEVGD